MGTTRSKTRRNQNAVPQCSSPGRKQATQGPEGSPRQRPERFVMADKILDDLLLLELSKEVNVVEVPPEAFSVILGFSNAEGASAAVSGRIAGSQQQAIHQLLHKYVDKFGTTTKTAQALFLIFKDNGMTKAAEHLETAMTKKGVALVKEPSTLPSPPSDAPAMTKKGVALVKEPSTLPSPPSAAPAMTKKGVALVKEPSTLPSPPSDAPGRSAMTPELKKLQDLLKLHYQKTFSNVRSSPFDPESRKTMEEIFTSLILQHGRKKENCKDEPFSYHKLFEILQNKRKERDCPRIVLVGEAGAGKTTLLRKAALDWANEKHLQEVDLFFLVPVRAIAKTEFFGAGVVKYIPTVRGFAGHEIDDYINADSLKVMILLDALDESDLSLVDPNPDVAGTGILRGELFVHTPVIVTTRPSHTDQIYRVDDVHELYTYVRVEGFKPEDVNKYVKAYFHDQPARAESLIAFIEGNKNVRDDMVSVPIFCAMLCYVWQAESKRAEVKELKTFSQLFRLMLSSLQQQAIPKAMPTGKVKAEYPRRLDESRDYLQKVGQIALECLLKEEFVFGEDECISCMDAVEAACKMGVLTKEERSVPFENTLEGETSFDEYRFPHKLLMEYTSSMYLHSLYQSNPSEYHKVVREMLCAGGMYMHKYKYKYVLGFMLSHGGEQAKALMGALCAMVRVSSNPTNVTDIAHVAGECLDKTALQPVVEWLTTQHRITVIDYSRRRDVTLGFLAVLEACGHQLMEADGARSATRLSDSQSGSSVSSSLGATASPHGESVKLEGMAAAAAGLCLLPKLEELKLFRVDLPEEFYSSMLSVSHMSRITTIHICYVTMTRVMLHAILGLSCLQSLKMEDIRRGQRSEGPLQIPKNVRLESLNVVVSDMLILSKLRLAAIRPKVEHLTLGSIETAHTLRSAEVEEMCNAVQNLNRLSIYGILMSIDDPVSLCRAVMSSCPGLTKIRFCYLKLSNTAVRSMVALLVEHQSLRHIEFERCHTDGKDKELNELIRQTNQQGKLTVDVHHAMDDLWMGAGMVFDSEDNYSDNLLDPHGLYQRWTLASIETTPTADRDGPGNPLDYSSDSDCS